MGTSFAKRWVKSAMIFAGLMPLVMLHGERTPPAGAQTLPSVIGLASTVPADALSVEIATFTLNDQPYASVTYTRTEPAQLLFTEMARDLVREYMDLYRWDGSFWRKVFDGYQFAQAFYRESPIATAAATPTRDPINLVGDRPTAETAFVSFDVKPLIRWSFDESRMPDLLSLKMSYFLGPSGLEHPFPSLALLLPIGDGFATVYATDFGVRGTIRSVYRAGDSVFVLADAVLPGDGACCPSGTEFVRLLWRSGTLVEAERCVRPDFADVSCGSR